MVKLVNGVGVKRSNKQYTEQDRINTMEMINMFTSDSDIIFAVDSVIFYLLPLYKYVNFPHYKWLN